MLAPWWVLYCERQRRERRLPCWITFPFGCARCYCISFGGGGGGGGGGLGPLLPVSAVRRERRLSWVFFFLVSFLLSAYILCHIALRSVRGVSFLPSRFRKFGKSTGSFNAASSGGSNA
eukprot:scaffold84772_cov41-Attheya_sp.AAC.1